LFSRLLSKNLNIGTHKNIVLPVALYRCETCSLTLKDINRLRMLENRILRIILGLIQRKWREAGEDCTIGSFITYTFHQTLSG
jgi:hypothetical protein